MNIQISSSATAFAEPASRAVEEKCILSCSHGEQFSVNKSFLKENFDYFKAISHFNQ